MNLSKIKDIWYLTILGLLFMNFVFGEEESQTTESKNLDFFFFAPESYKEFLDNIAAKFSEYAVAQNIGYNLKMVYQSDDDETEYGMKIEKLLDEESTDYDLYFYNIHHTYRFSKKMLNLKKIISIFSLMNFDNDVTLKSGIVDNKLVGVPIIAEYGTIYYNKKLLDKWNRSVPTTWKELLESLIYIYQREYGTNNNDIIGYIGNIPNDSYAAIDTIQEMIYSYRDEIESEDLPDYRSEKAVEAVSYLKYLLDKFSKPEYFKLKKDEIIEKIKTGNVLFARTFNFPNDDEDINFIPILGTKKGQSSSSIGGYHVGVPDHLSEERQNEISLIMNYLMSEDLNAYIVKEEKRFSALGLLYRSNNTGPFNDEIFNVCNTVDCDTLSSLQFFNKPLNYYDDNYDDYASAFLDIINEFFYVKNATVEATLGKIGDLTRIYDVDVSSTAGSLTIVLLGIVGVIMIASYLLIFDRKYNIYFMFLNNTYWGVFLIGTVLILMYGIVSLGEMNQDKCNLRFVVLSLGIPISFSPLLLRLIVLYPENNKISEHINRNFSNYLCCHVLFELALCTAYLLFPFDVTNHLLNVSDGLENFQSCDCKTGMNKAILIIDIAEKGLEIFVFAVLIFAEWNIKATKSDIVSLTIAIICDIIAFTLYAVFYFMEFKNRFSYFAVKVGPVLLFGLSNFFFIYVWKFAIMFTSEKDEIINKEVYLQKKTNVDAFRNMTRMSLKGRSDSLDGRSNENVNGNKDGGLINKIIRCHYETVGHGPNSPDASRTNVVMHNKNSNGQSSSTHGSNQSYSSLVDRNVRNFPSPN